MSEELIKFKCILLQSEIDRFLETNTLPTSFIDGTWSLNDLHECLGCFHNQDQEMAAHQLIHDYEQYMIKNLSQLQESLRKKYRTIISHMNTQAPQFIFPTVMSRYREYINPIKALYHDTREIVNNYDRANTRHLWLANLFQDEKFNDHILEALDLDMDRLNKIIQEYNWIFLNKDINTPLELLHAKQCLTDFSYYYDFFQKLKNWNFTKSRYNI